MSKVSVGVVLHNRSAHLEACLRSLFRNHSVVPFQLILVDNASTDQTPQLATQILQNAPCEYVLHRRTKNNLSQARNDILRLATGELIAFTDDDCEVPDLWLQELLRQWNLTPRDTVGLGGANRPPQGHRLDKLFQLFERSFLNHGGSSQINQSPDLRECAQVSTCNGIFLRKILIEVGGFSEQANNAGEDLDLSFKLRRHGHRLYFSGRCQVIHHLPTNFLKWLRKCFIYGESQWPILWANGLGISKMRLLPMVVLAAAVMVIVFAPKVFAVLFMCHWLWGGFQSRSLWAGLDLVLTQWTYVAGYAWGFLQTIVRGSLIRVPQAIRLRAKPTKVFPT